MKILLDPQALFLGKSGMQRYYFSLYRGLVEQGIDVMCEIPLSDLERIYFYNTIPGKAGRVLSRMHQKKIISRYHKTVGSGNYDILFITAFNFEIEFLKHLPLKPYVMTVHDTMKGLGSNQIYFDFSHGDAERIGYLAHQSTKTLCVSDYTKADLCGRFSIPPEKTETVHLANFLPSSTSHIPGLPEQYLLFAGSRNGRKNFFDWFKAVASYLDENPLLKVVITYPLTESETYFIRKLNCFENFVVFENVDDQQLNTLYQHALCLVYPSLYEGFGLPVLEAMSNGCPVITSNLTSIPEVAGDAALLIDPTDPDEMLNALKKVHSSASLRKELKEKGLDRSKKFSKEKFIKETIRVLESALDQT
ncbi:MAG: glycosyltransferase family 4 protein [Balneolaceae bacterium]|nr:glycosyltransferase family 4 protein [Balneolaceae bacterium]